MNYALFKISNGTQIFSTCKSNNESYNGDIYCNPVSIVSYINTSTK